MSNYLEQEKEDGVYLDSYEYDALIEVVNISLALKEAALEGTLEDMVVLIDELDEATQGIQHLLDELPVSDIGSI